MKNNTSFIRSYRKNEKAEFQSTVIKKNLTELEKNNNVVSTKHALFEKKCSPGYGNWIRQPL